MAEPDHYRVLGVPRFAPPAAVRRAYVGQVKRHHDSGDTLLSDEKARRLGLAYWVLRHPERRADYDERLKARERRRTAAGRLVTKRPTPRIQLPPHRTGPRPGTRLTFIVSLLLLGGGIAWALDHRPQVRRSVERLANALPAARPVDSDTSRPTVAMIDEALLDYELMVTEGGHDRVERYVRRCFAEMRASAPPAMFDYCVALDGLAAADLSASAERTYFSAAERRARLARVAFRPADQALGRWEAVNRLVAVRPSPGASGAPAAPPTAE